MNETAKTLVDFYSRPHDPCERLVGCLQYCAFRHYAQSYSFAEIAEFFVKGSLYKGMVNLQGLSLLERVFYLLQKFVECGERLQVVNFSLHLVSAASLEDLISATFHALGIQVMSIMDRLEILQAYFVVDIMGLHILLHRLPEDSQVFVVMLSQDLMAQHLSWSKERLAEVISLLHDLCVDYSTDLGSSRQSVDAGDVLWQAEVVCLLRDAASLPDLTDHSLDLYNDSVLQLHEELSVLRREQVLRNMKMMREKLYALLDCAKVERYDYLGAFPSSLSLRPLSRRGSKQRGRPKTTDTADIPLMQSVVADPRQLRRSATTRNDEEDEREEKDFAEQSTELAASMDAQWRKILAINTRYSELVTDGGASSTASALHEEGEDLGDDHGNAFVQEVCAERGRSSITSSFYGHGMIVPEECHAEDEGTRCQSEEGDKLADLLHGCETQVFLEANGSRAVVEGMDEGATNSSSASVHAESTDNGHAGDDGEQADARLLDERVEICDDVGERKNLLPATDRSGDRLLMPASAGHHSVEDDHSGSQAVLVSGPEEVVEMEAEKSLLLNGWTGIVEGKGREQRRLNSSVGDNEAVGRRSGEVKTQGREAVTADGHKLRSAMQLSEAKDSPAPESETVPSALMRDLLLSQSSDNFAAYVQRAYMMIRNNALDEAMAHGLLESSMASTVGGGSRPSTARLESVLEKGDTADSDDSSMQSAFEIEDEQRIMVGGGDSSMPAASGEEDMLGGDDATTQSPVEREDEEVVDNDEVRRGDEPKSLMRAISDDERSSPTMNERLSALSLDGQDWGLDRRRGNPALRSSACQEPSSPHHPLSAATICMITPPAAPSSGRSALRTGSSSSVSLPPPPTFSFPTFSRPGSPMRSDGMFAAGSVGSQKLMVQTSCSAEALEEDSRFPATQSAQRSSPLRSSAAHRLISPKASPLSGIRLQLVMERMTECWSSIECEAMAAKARRNQRRLRIGKLVLERIQSSLSHSPPAVQATNPPQPVVDPVQPSPRKSFVQLEPAESRGALAWQIGNGEERTRSRSASRPERGETEAAERRPPEPRTPSAPRSRPTSRSAGRYPTKLSNFAQVKNALCYVCLAGAHQEEKRLEVLELLDFYSAGKGVSRMSADCVLFDEWKGQISQFVLLFYKAKSLAFKGVYVLPPESPNLRRVYGKGPPTIPVSPTEQMVKEFLKFETSSKAFKAIPVKALTSTVDALIIEPASSKLLSHH